MKLKAATTMLLIAVVFIAYSGTAHARKDVCFHKDTKLLVTNLSTNNEEWVRVEEVAGDPDSYLLKTVDVQNVGSGANLGTATIEESFIKHVRSGNPMEIVRIETANGKVLLLTPSHPIPTYDGRVIKAMDVTKRDELVSVQGGPIAVSNISVVKYEGPTYNFSSGGEKFIVAEGIVVGDYNLQIELNQK